MQGTVRLITIFGEYFPWKLNFFDVNFDDTKHSCVGSTAINTVDRDEHIKISYTKMSFNQTTDHFVRYNIHNNIK